MIVQTHRELIATWAEAGAIPDDLSTRQFAVSLVANVLAEHDAVVAAFSEPVAVPMGEPLPFEDDQ